MDLTDLATADRPLAIALLEARMASALQSMALDPTATPHNLAMHHATITVCLTLQLLVAGNPEKKRTWLIPPAMRQTERLTVTGMIQWKTQALEKLMRMPVTDNAQTQTQIDMVQRMIYRLTFA